VVAKTLESLNQSLQIIQYNVDRSCEIVMADFLRRKEVLEADIIALQEPWRNPFKDDTHHPAKATHYMLYPPPERNNMEEDRARVCLFVKKALSPGAWSHIAHSRDCQELQIRHTTPGGGERTLRLFNIYITGRNDFK
jgi:hypothetical protein